MQPRSTPRLCAVLRGAHIVPTANGELIGTILDKMRDDVGTLTELLNLGVNPKEQVPLFTVALPTYFMAVREGQIEAMRAFVRKGVDPTSKGARGWTPLMLAASADQSSMPTLQYLLENGADLNATDDDGRTALDWADAG